MNKYEILYKVASERRTAKEYDSNKNINKENMQKIFEFSNRAPHSMGLEFLRVINFSRNSKHKEEICNNMMGFNVNRSKQASDVALIITKKNSFIDSNNKELVNRVIRNTKFSKESRGEKYIKGDESNIISYLVSEDHAKNNNNYEEWMARQAYIHLGYMLLAAKSLNIDSTPAEGFRETINDYLLKNKIISNDEKVTLAVYFGYINENSKNSFVGNKQLRKSIDEYVKYL